CAQRFTSTAISSAAFLTTITGSRPMRVVNQSPGDTIWLVCPTTSHAWPKTRSISSSNSAGSADTERCKPSGWTSGLRLSRSKAPMISNNISLMRIPISIVGGGIGGLSLARELSLRGLPARVFERAPRLDPVGAGIIMNPNAMAVLEKNGLAAEVRRESWPYLTRETRDRDGALLATRDYRPLYDSGKLAQGALVHRAHLLDVLYRSLPDGVVRFGVEVQ